MSKQPQNGVTLNRQKLDNFQGGGWVESDPVNQDQADEDQLMRWLEDHVTGGDVLDGIWVNMFWALYIAGEENFKRPITEIMVERVNRIKKERKDILLSRKEFPANKKESLLAMDTATIIAKARILIEDIGPKGLKMLTSALDDEKAPVESPLAGTVGRVYVDIGSSVTPQTPIAIVCNMGNAEIDLNIPERYLPNVSLGQEAEVVVDAYPNEIFIGKVDQISPVVDLATRAAPVEIVIDNTDKTFALDICFIHHRGEFIMIWINVK